MSDSLFEDGEMGAAPYVVLARKYRPQTFDDLIGQDAMVATLKNAFAQGRIAQGYMLTGVRGVGKTTTARILARALNFEPLDGDGDETGPTVNLPRDPAQFGRHCAEIMESRHADVIEMDAASNTGVDNRARDHRKRTLQTPCRPLQGIHHRRGAYAIEGAHSMRSSRHLKSRQNM